MADYWSLPLLQRIIGILMLGGLGWWERRHLRSRVKDGPDFLGMVDRGLSQKTLNYLDGEFQLWQEYGMCISSLAVNYMLHPFFFCLFCEDFSGRYAETMDGESWWSSGEIVGSFAWGLNSTLGAKCFYVLSCNKVLQSKATFDTIPNFPGVGGGMPLLWTTAVWIGKVIPLCGWGK